MSPDLKEKYQEYIHTVNIQHPDYFKFKKEFFDRQLKTDIFGYVFPFSVYILLVLTCAYFFGASGVFLSFFPGSFIYWCIYFEFIDIEFYYELQRRDRMDFLCREEGVCFHADNKNSGMSWYCDRQYEFEKPYREKEQAEYDAVMTSTPYSEIQRSLEHVLQEYAQVESDPRTIISIPLILDITVPQTRSFHEILQETQEVRDDILSAEKYGKATRKHVQIVDNLVQSWEEALNYARRIGMNGITEREKEKASKLLNRVLHPVNEYELDLDRAALIRILENVEYENSKTYRNDRLDVQKIIDEHALMIEAKETIAINS